MTANNRGGLTPHWPPPSVYYQWFMRVTFWASPKPVAWVLLTIPSLQPRGWGMENSKVGTGPTTGLCCPEWVRRGRSGSCWDRGTSKGRKDLRNICSLTPCNEQIQLNKYLQVALSLIKPKKLGDVHRLLLLPGMRLCNLTLGMWHRKKGLLSGEVVEEGVGSPCLLLPFLSQEKGSVIWASSYPLAGGGWSWGTIKGLLDLAWLSLWQRGWDYPQAPTSQSGLSLLHWLACQDM